MYYFCVCDTGVSLLETNPFCREQGKYTGCNRKLEAHSDVDKLVCLKKRLFLQNVVFQSFLGGGKAHINCLKDVMLLGLEMVASQNVNTPTFSKAALCNSNVQYNPKISVDHSLGRMCTVRSETVVV